MATVTTTDEKIIVDRDYSDNFSVKETALNTLVPKYFGDEALAQLNVGALGFTMEQIANITEDSFNTMSTLVHEAFPNKAIIPENIYCHAAVFQIDNTYTRCAQCSFVMLLTQEDILQYGTTVGRLTTFYIDKGTIFTVIGNDREIPFTLDYDIMIQAQKKQVSGSEWDYNYSAKYVLDFRNAISSINDPYLKIRKLPNGTILLQFTAHQAVRTVIEDTITTNTKINYPVKTYSFENGLAGFDVLYKNPGEKTWTQLTPKIKFSLPSKEPFCYYKLRDDETLEISFSTRDGYFKPEFNSSLKIILYTTIGTAGEFLSYTGNNITITPCTDTWDYNEDIVMAVKPVSDSSGAGEKMSLEALQALTVESYSSATEISSETDLYNYFMNFKYRYGNEICVIKRRDDVTERLYSAFLLMKNNDYIYPTNTMNFILAYDEYDFDDGIGKFMLKPGHVWIYANDNSNRYLTMVKDVWVYDTEKVNELMKTHQFVYTNPFLICMTRTPNLVGIYQNIIDEVYGLDYVSANENSFVQFITSKMRLHRSLAKDAIYDLEVSLIPSGSTDPYVFNLNTNEGNKATVVAALCNNAGEELVYIPMVPTAIDPNDTSHVTFTGKIEIDDIVTSNGYIKVLNGIKRDDSIPDNPNIPIKGVNINVYVLYNEGVEMRHTLTDVTGLSGYTVTNVYNNRSNPATLIQPMNMMRSTVRFSNVGTVTEPKISTRLSLIPVVKADIIQDETNFNFFINRLSANYNYITECADILRGNTNIDVKFYNTYGRSHNYTIGDDGEMIDRVNIAIKFKVTLVDGADELSARKAITSFVKQFIERVNAENGANNLYISNLIRELENSIPSIHYLKFMGINDYDTNYQTISIKESDINNLTKEDRRNYVPEIIVVNPDDIQLAIITN